MVLVTGASGGSEGPGGLSLSWVWDEAAGWVGTGGWLEEDACDWAETCGGGAGREGRAGFSGGSVGSPGGLWGGASWDWCGRVGLVITST